MKGTDRVDAIDASTPRMVDNMPGVPVDIIALMRLMRAANQGLSNFLEPVMRPFGFTESSFHTLMLIFSSEQGTATPSQLCELVGQTRANMTHILAGLVSQSYVSRSTDGDDGRRRIIRITAEGRRLVRATLPTLAAPLSLALEGLKPADITQLDKLLRRFVASLANGERRMRASI
ncbi:MAG: MarR family transcriptional regulator [Hydrocarboniphaga sp.]|uniref:MarR family winged helix-turn-helix transcriptional regulator n=1 Tax=Hydrocarboniphaga sp. TaxID=2033016 RepID=UPI002615A060|nr:MarR family winged helix-turn-helix transcriptional regulator [Hydrocarboniphaga sp.]MDB5970062.1 MarR family transcriptional regulator [Hydrocarboniphaga sp.]